MHAPLPSSTARHGERGQTVIIVTLFMVALLGVAATAIDVGSWYWAKHEAQAAADAAALAGAAELPTGWPSAQLAATSNFAQNGRSGDHVSYANTSTASANDSVTVSVDRVAPSYFARVFGIGEADISVSATATVKSIIKLTNSPHVVPWGITQASWIPGAQYQIYTDNSTANNGSLSLPVSDGSGGCSPTQGAGDYRTSIAGEQTVCDVTVGQIVDVKTGQNTGPTKQGIDTRVPPGTWQPLDAIVQYSAGGTATILQPDSPQLVVLPVVIDVAGNAGWPTGGGQVRIVGFAAFVLTEPGYAEGGRTVIGTFVQMQMENTSGSTGQYTPGTGGLYTVELTR